MARDRVYLYDADVDVFRCRDCDYRHHDAGAVRLHWHQKHGNGAEKGWATKKGKRTAAGQGEEQPATKRDGPCRHDRQVEILRRTHPVEARAMEDGWAFRCQTCGVLLRRDGSDE